jgi:photosystem II stability/assembly factor-like uncharacterized protein
MTRATLTGVAGALLLLAGAPSGSSSGDYGLLQRFAPQSATTWWAIVESNLTSRSWVVRTADGGRRWQDVTPPIKVVVSSAFAGARTAWIETNAVHPGPTEPLYRTLDGGRTWRVVASLPSECELDFVDLQHGWCTSIGAATGSETVNLLRTTDGGSSWVLVSHTGLFDKASTSGALPYACDKTIAFTSPTVGWAAQYCNGGDPRLYVSRDSGMHWKALAHVPLPRRLLPTAGEGLSTPAVSGSLLTVSVDVGGLPHGATVIATSQNGGGSWRTQLVPGSMRYWTVDLIDVQHWRLSDGTTLLSTGDAGRHWQSRRSSVQMKDIVGSPLALRFLSPCVGFAIPDGNNGPLWRTRDGGSTWQPIRIHAGPFTVPRS